MSNALSLTIIRGSSTCVKSTPRPQDLLNKIHTLEQIKKIFLSNTQKESSIEQTKTISATEAALKIQGKTLIEVIRGKQSYFTHSKKEDINPLEKLADNLFEIEKEYPNSTVAYHGNKSSLLPDIYGALAQALTICEEAVPLMRLEASIFEEDVQTVLRKEEYIHDHSESIRSRFISASPTLISDIDSKQLENALCFYSKGESIAKESAQDRLFRLIEAWKLKKFIPRSLAKSVSMLESDFPQYAYIHQIFLHDSKTANQISYPSKAFGSALICQSTFCSTSEFISALKSENLEEKINYQRKYSMDLNHIQLRILADPRVFLNKERATIYCHRDLPIDEWQYHDKIRRAVVDPILRAGIKKGGPGGLFSLSPLAKTLGSQVLPLARLADYVFIGADDPRLWVVYGNKEAVVKALQTQQIFPMTTFGKKETLLELSLLAGQATIFEILFEHFKCMDLIPTEKLATKILPLCFKHNLVEAATHFLNYVNDPKLIKHLLIQSCEKNSHQLIRQIIDTKYGDGLIEFANEDLDNCIKGCLKNQNLEYFPYFLEEYSKIKKKYDPLHLKLIFYVIQYLPPQSLQNTLLLFQRAGYDVDFLEQHFIYKFMSKYEENALPFSLSSYKDYAESLSKEERSKLALQNWWNLVNSIELKI